MNKTWIIPESYAILHNVFMIFLKLENFGCMDFQCKDKNSKKIFKKIYFHLCPQDELKSYKFGTIKIK